MSWPSKISLIEEKKAEKQSECMYQLSKMAHISPRSDSSGIGHDLDPRWDITADGTRECEDFRCEGITSQMIKNNRRGACGLKDILCAMCNSTVQEQLNLHQPTTSLSGEEVMTQADLFSLGRTLLKSSLLTEWALILEHHYLDVFREEELARRDGDESQWSLSAGIGTTRPNIPYDFLIASFHTTSSSLPYQQARLRLSSSQHTFVKLLCPAVEDVLTVEATKVAPVGMLDVICPTVDFRWAPVGTDGICSTVCWYSGFSPPVYGANEFV
ncbi:hypothetical protein B0H17DRAFT_1137970 [Mycena rosella]|uniref:Uncharacterized protein n=1 Tax=Mycena rosella TaxID=1033263 RepID=A0AAD7D7I3_MYCRO|nr:hypothetical protein B0H17DRAFT_1137970 [Mycena rosella]